MKFEEVEEYLRSYSLVEPPYDANGAIHLLKAIIENLDENFSKADYEDYSGNLDKKDEEFLSRILKYIPQSRSNLEE